MSSPGSPRGSEPKFEIDREILAASVIRSNLGQEILIISRDRAKLCLIEYRELLESRGSWIAPAGIFASLLATLVAADFVVDFAGLKAAVWKAMFVLCCAGSFFWLLTSIWKARLAVGKGGIEGLVQRMIESQKREFSLSETRVQLRAVLKHNSEHFDFVGQKASTSPSGVPDWTIVLNGLDNSKGIKDVEVRSTEGGMWRSWLDRPGKTGNWIVAYCNLDRFLASANTTKLTNVGGSIQRELGEVILFFEPFKDGIGGLSFEVEVLYEDDSVAYAKVI